MFHFVKRLGACFLFFLREELYRNRSLAIVSAEKINLKDCIAHWANLKKYQRASKF